MSAKLRSWVRAVFGRSRFESQMADEIRFHLEARAGDLERGGMSRREAERTARLEFGAVESYKEKSRESRGLRWFDELAQDLKYAWRQLRQAPAFSLMAMAILGIGIGGSVAMFSALDAVMLRMLPIPRPEELRHFQWTSRQPGYHTSYDGSSTRNPAGERVEWSTSYPLFEYLRDHNSTFSSLFGFVSSIFRVGLGIDGHAHLTLASVVSPEYFASLETMPILGRTLTAEDDRPSGESSVTVIGYGLWQRLFGGDRSVLGKTVTMNGVPVVIVGVLPQGFCGVNLSRCAEIFLPMSMYPAASAEVNGAQWRVQSDRWYLEVMGRLKPGVQEERARTEIEALLRQAILDYKPSSPYELPRVQLLEAGGGVGRLRGSMVPPLRILSWVVAAVLAIACANLAGLLLARASARQREIGTRLAIGAGRGRLIRQLLTESLLLSVLGGVVGMGLAILLGDTILHLFISGNDPVGLRSTVDLRLLLFAVALCLLTGLIFGLAPALRAARQDPLSALRMAGVTAGHSRFRIGKTLIGVQVALSVMLVAGSALFLRTLANLRGEKLGFRPENLLVFQLNPTLNGYKDQRILNFHEDVLRKINGIPGVRVASMSRWGMLSGSATSSGIQNPGHEKLQIYIHFVGPRFPEAWGVPLLAGQDITFADRETSQKVALVNETLARQVFGETNPLGQMLIMGKEKGKVQIVGIVGDARYDSLRRGIPPTMYIPFRQAEQFSMTYAVRSEMEPKAMIGGVRQAVESVDRNVPMYEVKTQTEQINQLIQRERVFAMLLSAFAAIALILACLGIFGTLAYLVGRRTPEIGIRMALGAQRRSVVALVLGESLVSVGLGVVAGVAAALASGKLVESQLFGVKPNDPATLVVAGFVLCATALAAGLLPALRASRISPVQALRHE